MGVCVAGCVRGWVCGFTMFVSTVTDCATIRMQFVVCTSDTQAYSLNTHTLRERAREREREREREI